MAQGSLSHGLTMESGFKMGFHQWGVNEKSNIPLGIPISGTVTTR
nr:MAG TPA: hypothetical protein [Caudoviricetes sp.]